MTEISDAEDDTNLKLRPSFANFRIEDDSLSMSSAYFGKEECPRSQMVGSGQTFLVSRGASFIDANVENMSFLPDDLEHAYFSQNQGTIAMLHDS